MEEKRTNWLDLVWEKLFHIMQYLVTVLEYERRPKSAGTD